MKSRIVGALFCSALALGSTDAAAVSSITPNTTLNPNSFIYSPNGQYRLSMQGDGNLVSYAPNGQAKWMTHTQDHPNSRAVMQTDGNFVIYDPSNVPVFLSRTQNQPTNQSFASYQDNGDLIILTYQASWATNTPNSNQPSSASGGGTLVSGASLSPNSALTSGNGVFTLTMQGDGNLVLTSSGGYVQWASFTYGAGNYAVMQGDGNFVVYSASNQPLWSSNTARHPSSILTLQDDGNLVLYTPVPTYSFDTGPINNYNVTTVGNVNTGRGVYICPNGFLEPIGVSCPNPTPACYVDFDGNFHCPPFF